MRQSIAAALCVCAMAAGVLLPGCRAKKTDALPDETGASTEALTSGQAQTDAKPSVSSGGETGQAPVSDEETAEGTETPAEDRTEQTAGETEPRAEETEMNETGSSDGQKDGIIGVSANGRLIERRDGITYVDGVLVANKTYALPASYAPGDLTGETEAAFGEMRDAAAEDGVDLWIVSGFRSYGLQESLYNRYVSEDGRAAADRYSARPGHSEHQTGLAMDLNDVSYSFADTEAGRWVAENCWRYGFILRYPENKESQTGYRYEPWHVRYLGKTLAAEVFRSGLCLEEYLGITSEYQS